MGYRAHAESHASRIAAGNEERMKTGPGFPAGARREAPSGYPARRSGDTGAPPVRGADSSLPLRRAPTTRTRPFPAPVGPRFGDAFTVRLLSRAIVPDGGKGAAAGYRARTNFHAAAGAEERGRKNEYRRPHGCRDPDVSRDGSGPARPAPFLFTVSLLFPAIVPDGGEGAAAGYRARADSHASRIAAGNEERMKTGPGFPAGARREAPSKDPTG